MKRDTGLAAGTNILKHKTGKSGRAAEPPRCVDCSCAAPQQKGPRPDPAQVLGALLNFPQARFHSGPSSPAASSSERPEAAAAPTPNKTAVLTECRRMELLLHTEEEID